MKQSLILWITAFFITAGSAVFQRVTGPSYPVAGTAQLGPDAVAFRLERSHAGGGDARIMIPVGDPEVSGTVRWKRYGTPDAWTEVPMARRDSALLAALPHQPPGGKLEYRVVLRRATLSAALPPDGPVTIRFRGDVPAAVLLPHILAMFLAMLFSTRAGLETFSATPAYGRLTAATMVMLAAGGLLLGPVVQWYAFGELWTGWPLGTDLTDNKTALAFLGWLTAAVALRRTSRPKAWILGAAILLLAVYLIPHSVFGTQLDYTARMPAPH